MGEAFGDYWRGKAGAAARKCDWLATWRNWCRRERERETHGPPMRANGGNGGGLWTLNGPALDALARELGIAKARPGESLQTFIGRIQAAQGGRDRLH